MFSRVYFDHAATTPIDREVLDAMMPYLTDKFGNASSIHYFGQETRAVVDKSRQQVAELINARPTEIIFTSGGTEANNLAIRGLIELRSGNDELRPHIITTNIEHPAVQNVCAELERRGSPLTYLPVNDEGVIRAEDVRNAVTENTCLISVMAANNEIGTLQPIAEIGKIVRELRSNGRKIWFHTDAEQAAGKIPLDVEEIGCDLLTISAHKIYAPKGIGALYVRRGTRLQPQNLGGRQERGMRGGTESVPLIAAFGKAAAIAISKISEDPARIGKLRQRFEDSIFERIEGSILNGGVEERLPNISNISFHGVEGEALLINLDMQGFAVSTGSACSSGSLEPSPVIRALGADDQRARSAIRFSFGRENTIEEVDRLIELLPACVEKLGKLSPASASATRT
jgi:cysteine desulfurase